MEDGASAEIAIIGNEGILGISLFMGGNTTPSRAIVQSAGHAFRLTADLLRDEFERYGPTMHLLLRYTRALITQMAQTAVCHRTDRQTMVAHTAIIALDQGGGNGCHQSGRASGECVYPSGECHGQAWLNGSSHRLPLSVYTRVSRSAMT